MEPVDAIRSIERDTTHGKWAKLFGGGTSTWYFTDPPQRLSKGSLIFFAVHGLIQGVGRYVKTSTKRDARGFYVVTTEINDPIVDPTLKFRGYAQLRYLDVLPTQYKGKYKELCKKLRSIAKRYRSGE